MAKLGLPVKSPVNLWNAPRQMKGYALKMKQHGNTWNHLVYLKDLAVDTYIKVGNPSSLFSPMDTNGYGGGRKKTHQVLLHCHWL
jgi:hypothetical protein